LLTSASPDLLLLEAGPAARWDRRLCHSTIRIPAASRARAPSFVENQLTDSQVASNQRSASIAATQPAACGPVRLTAGSVLDVGGSEKRPSTLAAVDSLAVMM
jgi:hypothetical protein